MGTDNLLVEGKTKRVYTSTEHGDDQVVIKSKDDITAGDGDRRDTINGKGAFSNKTTSNVFRLLKECGIPVAFTEQSNRTEFRAQNCRMVPIEVVIRREAYGSFLRRHPTIGKRHIFPKLIPEFYLKTSERQWNDMSLPVDDPLMRFTDDRWALHHPGERADAEPFASIYDFPYTEDDPVLETMRKVAVKSFLILEKAWSLAGKRLVDCKMEFGLNGNDQLLLADVVDNDSWRLFDGDRHLDKQLYRDGADLDTVAEAYRLVADLTDTFSLPRQRIIVWLSNKSGDLALLSNLFKIAFETLLPPESVSGFDVREVVCSPHKNWTRCQRTLTEMIQEVPDSVVITCYGGNIGEVGSILAAQCGIPVISVPAPLESKNRDSVWLSLLTMDDMPVATILGAKNAALFALRILAARNPLLYALQRQNQEQWVENTAEI